MRLPEFKSKGYHITVLETPLGSQEVEAPRISRKLANERNKFAVPTRRQAE